MEHWFWTLVVIAVLMWYIIVTAIVAVKGGQDIWTMIREWKENL